MENLGRLKDDEGRDLGRVVSVNGKACFLPRDADAMRYVASRNDDEEINPIGLNDNFAERVSDYGDLRRALYDQDGDFD
ncbi:hypothetical protein HYT23_05975 [Candidatus Pacearchaeota archaeon]|nr:hypothetical protein [Candidatus Pacearchaeota archaeon]